MPVQMIELEEVMMVEDASDNALEMAAGAQVGDTAGVTTHNLLCLTIG